MDLDWKQENKKREDKEPFNNKINQNLGGVVAVQMSSGNGKKWNKKKNQKKCGNQTIFKNVSNKIQVD